MLTFPRIMATQADIVKNLLEAHNDISCEIELNPLDQITSPYQMKIALDYLMGAQASHMTLTLNYDDLVKHHTADIGENGMEAWKEWRKDIDLKFKDFMTSLHNKAEELVLIHTRHLQGQSTLNPNSPDGLSVSVTPVDPTNHTSVGQLDTDWELFCLERDVQVDGQLSSTKHMPYSSPTLFPCVGSDKLPPRLLIFNSHVRYVVLNCTSTAPVLPEQLTVADMAHNLSGLTNPVLWERIDSTRAIADTSHSSPVMWPAQLNYFCDKLRYVDKAALYLLKFSAYYDSIEYEQEIHFTYVARITADHCHIPSLLDMTTKRELPDDRLLDWVFQPTNPKVTDQCMTRLDTVSLTWKPPWVSLGMLLCVFNFFVAHMKPQIPVLITTCYVEWLLGEPPWTLKETETDCLWLLSLATSSQPLVW